MHVSRIRPFRILARCLRGLENNLISELQSFGFKNESLIKQKGGIIIPDGDANKLGFLSYFSRISSGVCIDVANVNIESKEDVTNTCPNIKWEEYIRPLSSIMVNCVMSPTASIMKSKKYLSQLVKDCIVSYFNEELKIEPPKIDYKNPDISLYVNVDSQSNAYFLIDAIGHNLNSRGYRHKPGIVDINGPLACALLQDIGYIDYKPNCFDINEFTYYLKTGNFCSTKKIETAEGCWGENVLVDIFAGCGVLLIEAALHALRIAPGELIPNFAWQSFELGQDANALFQALKSYSSEKRVTSTSQEYTKLKGTLVGIERNWEKVESILVSAERANVLETILVSQANILKHGLQDIKDVVKGCKFMVAQLPKKLDLDGMPSTCSAGDVLSPERYQQLLVNLGKHKQRYMPNATSLIIAPSIIDSECIQVNFGGCAKTIKRFTKGGIQYCAHKVS